MVPELDSEDRRSAIRTRVVAIALFWLLAVVYSATASYDSVQVNDTRAASVASWALATTGGPALPEHWAAHHAYWGVETDSGQVLVNRFPAVAYWATPMYAISRAIGGPVPTHPLEVPVWPAALTAALTSAAAGAVLFRLLRLNMSETQAAWSTLVAAFGTSLWSVAADAMWPHGPVALSLTLCVYGARTNRMVLAGGSAAVAVTARPSAITAVAIMAVGIFALERRARPAVLVGAGGLFGLALVSTYSYKYFNQPLPTAGYDAGAHLAGMWRHSPWQTLRDSFFALLSIERGVLISSPVVGLAGLGLVKFRREVPVWSVVTAVAGCVMLLVHIRLIGYRGGEGFFSYRLPIEALILATPALSVGLLSLWASARRWRWAIVGACVLSVVAHAAGALGFA